MHACARSAEIPDPARTYPANPARYSSVAKMNGVVWAIPKSIELQAPRAGRERLRLDRGRGDRPLTLREAAIASAALAPAIGAVVRFGLFVIVAETLTLLTSVESASQLRGPLLAWRAQARRTAKAGQSAER